MNTTIEPCAIERTVEYEPAALEQGRRPEIAPATDPMMAMLSSAVSSGNLELVKELYAFKKQVEEDEAKRAYVQAMADFKAEAIRVTKDKENKQYGSRYTSLGNLINTVTPFLSKHGLSADWELDQSNGIRVVCVMTHRLGYSKRFPFTGTPDASGSKNPLQQIKSTITYGKIVTFESACGLASTEGNADDDGNGAGAQGQQLSEEEFLSRRDAIEGANDVDELKKFYLASVEAAKKIGDQHAVKDFAAAKDKRWRELKGAR